MPRLGGDRPLLEAFRRGDREALETVYEEYAPLVASFLARGFTFVSKGRQMHFRGYHQPFDLENTLHETFARAFGERARLAYDGLTPYRRYVIAIARNLVLSELRIRELALSQLVTVDDGEPLEAVFDSMSEAPVGTTPPEEGGAEGAYLLRELASLYQQFVDQLEPNQRVFFVARFEDGMTQVESGRCAGLSHMQSRSLEKKLRRQFLRFMQNHGYLERCSDRRAPVIS
ncbi:MAG: sigma-70 family RNA polymerase sigma factor [Deltaproteobacteria bacterium]|nr:sigma-70 family RNA polymerase sigma factor [Deltaproteobacteria bacterium]